MSDLAYGLMADDDAVAPRRAADDRAGAPGADPARGHPRRADPDDRDGDGISGRPNMVVDLVSGERELGRFGWDKGRCQHPGATPRYRRYRHRDAVGDEAAWRLQSRRSLRALRRRPASRNGSGHPRRPIRCSTFVTFYSQNLGVPQRRIAGDCVVLRGKRRSTRPTARPATRRNT